MKKKVIAITVTLLVAIAGALTLVQCDHSNMARVTIHIQNDLYAQKTESIIDKLLALISTNVYAGGWLGGHESGELLLAISGPNIAPIDTTIPTIPSSFTTEVPAGSPRTIRLIYDNKLDPDMYVTKTYGGEKTVTLKPGDNDVTILMLPITKISSASRVESEIAVSWQSVSLTGKTISYNLYRSINVNGTYNKVNEIPETGTSITDTANFTEGETYYYRVSVLTDGVEGLLCESYEVVF